MAKFAMLAAVLVALVAVQGFPADRDNDISAAAAHGDWDLVHKLIKDQFNNQHIWEPSFTSGSVRSLKPIPGGKVFGTSEYSFHTSSNVNGEKNEKSGGHRVINDNGNIKEYDFVPTF